MSGPAERSAPEMQEKPPTAASSGFKLPMPSPEVEQGELPGAAAASADAHPQQHHQQQKPMSAGDASAFASTMEADGDSGLFTFNRPSTAGGQGFHSNSSYYAGAGSRLNTGIGISSIGRPLTGRPLTGMPIPEEEPYEEELDQNTASAAIAAAYRDGRAMPPTRAGLATPIIELDERMRSATQREHEKDELSTPSGSHKTDFADYEKEDGRLGTAYDQMDPEELLKLGEGIDYLNGMGGSDDMFEEEEDSPFPEVRASVSNYDDPDMPCLTFRALALGCFFTSLGAGLNAYFQIRYPAPFITTVVIQLISYPVGTALARWLPAREWSSPKLLRRLGMDSEWSLNPGPFNIKEHTVIVIMANVSISPTYGLGLVLSFDKYFNIKTGFWFDFLLIFSTTVTGFVFAGLTRRFLVWPANLIWPQNLVTSTLLNTFHAGDDGDDGGMSRYRFFFYVFIGATVWYLVPGFLFTGLSAFSWLCWIAPKSPVVNQLFGVSTGLGMGIFTFDWSQIAYLGSPLMVPWWAIVNIFVGFVILYWILTPILYYTNVWDMGYLPISVNGIFDRFGNQYNTSAVLTPDLRLDVEAYERYSPLIFPSTFVVVYCLTFALATASLVHTAIYHGPEMWRTFRNIKTAQTDIHAKLMLAYKEVPTWWYIAIFAACMAMSIGLNEGYHTGFPVWGLLLAVALVGLYILPGGIIYAMSAQQITINVLAEAIPGVLLPGQPIPNVMFKVYSIQSIYTGLFFIQDLKLGHYMKIPHRVTFSVQLLAMVLAVAVQSGIKEGLLKGVPDLCSPDQAAHLICPTARSAYNASVIWGLIGPSRMFGRGSPYVHILWSLLAGALLPVIIWFIGKRFKISYTRLPNLPVMLSGASYIPPATGINYSSWFLVAFVFQYLLRRLRYRWWAKFSFVTSAAMDSGTAISLIFIFLCLQLPKSGTISLNWWGNLVYTETDDYNGVPIRQAPPDGFGRQHW